MMCQRIGMPPISTIGLGRASVSSERRVPRPPARSTAFILLSVLAPAIDRDIKSIQGTHLADLLILLPFGNKRGLLGEEVDQRNRLGIIVEPRQLPHLGYVDKDDFGRGPQKRLEHV